VLQASGSFAGALRCGAIFLFSQKHRAVLGGVDRLLELDELAAESLSTNTQKTLRTWRFMVHCSRIHSITLKQAEYSNRWRT
jgi:hypothetical protein